MSKTGRDDEVDCRDVLSDVYLFLDNECDEQQRARIKGHLDDCSPCLRKFGIEQEVKALLARKCGGDVAPSGLRGRLQVRLSEVVITEECLVCEDGQVVATRVTEERTIGERTVGE